MCLANRTRKFLIGRAFLQNLTASVQLPIHKGFRAWRWRIDVRDCRGQYCHERQLLLKACNLENVSLLRAIEPHLCSRS
jgi:hypothetical protein